MMFYASLKTGGNANMVSAIAKKMGLTDGMRAFLVDAPPDAVDAIALPDLEIAAQLTGEFDYIHLFTRQQKDFSDHFPKLKSHLKRDGVLWVSWPKNRQLGTDLTLPTVIKLGYDHGLVESKTISINATWSAIKFTHPKQGKIYKNSYGRLAPEA